MPGLIIHDRKGLRAVSSQIVDIETTEALTFFREREFVERREEK
jgi:hypothetical protein